MQGVVVLSVQAALANVIVVPKGAAAPSDGPAGLRSLMLYDCKTDFLDTVQDWSAEKRAYCCQKSRVICGKVGERSPNDPPLRLQLPALANFRISMHVLTEEHTHTRTHEKRREHTYYDRLRIGLPRPTLTNSGY